MPRIIHYCHSPTRYLHGLVTDLDHANLPFLYRFCLPFFKFWLRLLDLDSVKRLKQKNTIWLTNSSFSQKTIKEIYSVDSEVIYPPIELEHFQKLPRLYQKNLTKNEVNEDFYYYFGRISFHKRLDLVILACLRLGRNLKICGATGFGPEMEKLRKLVSDFERENPQQTGLVEFLGRLENEQRDEYLAKCRAFIFATKEDFGIAPVEVLASGTPIIAFGMGGALEYVIDGKNSEFENVENRENAELEKVEKNSKNLANLEEKWRAKNENLEKSQNSQSINLEKKPEIQKINGVLFPLQSVKSLCEVILEFEKIESWDSDFIKQSVARFDQRYFVESIHRYAQFILGK